MRQRQRRSPEEADAVRARMVREGYPLAELSARENEQFWWSLVGRRRRRRPQLLALLRMTETELEWGIERVRRQRRQVTGRR
jgi:hypothetical protein